MNEQTMNEQTTERTVYKFTFGTTKDTTHDSEREDVVTLELMDAGFASVWVADGFIQATIEGGKERQANLLACAQALGLVVVSSEALNATERQWLGAWTELWQPLQCGRISVECIPGAAEFTSNEPALEETQNAAETIQIIPGLGFGTGHHATTESIINLLQHPLVTDLRPMDFLDVGTGSGILAIAAAKLFPKSLGLALDNDPYALDNARENLAGNGVIQRVTCILGEIAAAPTTPCSLILANIYAEVLCAIETEITSRAIPAGKTALILSGIMESKVQSVLNTYEKSWQIKERLSKNGWESLLLTSR